MRRLVLLVVLAMALVPARAGAVTVRDIVELTRAGLSEEVLLALIEVDGGVFAIDTPTLTMLKQAGVSEKVIAAMVRSGRIPPPPEPVVPVPADPPEPQIIVVEREPIVREVPVGVPIYVPIVSSRRTRHVRAERMVPFEFSVPPAFSLLHAPIPSSVAATAGHPRLPDKRIQEPVYWGWGGKLRPDAWKPK